MEVINMDKIDFKRKLTSRKLWVSIATFVSMLIIYKTGDSTKAEQISALIMAGAAPIAYIIAEGLTDAKAANNKLEDGNIFYITEDEETEEE